MSNADKNSQDVEEQASQIEEEGDNTQTKNTVSPATAINDALSRGQNATTDAINAADAAVVNKGQALTEAGTRALDRVEEKAKILNDFGVNLADCVKAFLATLSCPLLQSLKLLFQSQLHLISLGVQSAILQISALKAVIAGLQTELDLLRAAIQDPQEVVWKLIAERAPDAFPLLQECVDLATLLDSINKIDFIATVQKFIDQLASNIGRLSFQLDRLNYASQLNELITAKLNGVIGYIDFLCIGYTENGDNQTKAQIQLGVKSISQQVVQAVTQLHSDFEKELGKQLDNSTVTLSDVLALIQRETESGDNQNTPISEVPDRITLAVERILSGQSASVQTTTQESQQPLDPSLGPVAQSFVFGNTVTQILVDGTIVTRTTVNGVFVITEKFPDGKAVTIEPEKRTTVTPDGCVKVEFDTNYSEIVSVFSCPDGMITTTYGDGRVVKQFSNGWVEETDFRGNLKTTNLSFSFLDDSIDSHFSNPPGLPYGPDYIRGSTFINFWRDIVLPYGWRVSVGGSNPRLYPNEMITANNTFTITNSDESVFLTVNSTSGYILSTSGYTESSPIRFYELALDSTVILEEHENVSCDTSRNISVNDFPIISGPRLDENGVPYPLPGIGEKHGPPIISDSCIRSSTKLTNSNGDFLSRKVLADGSFITEKKIGDVEIFRFDQALSFVVDGDASLADYYELQNVNGVLTEIVKADSSISITEMLDSTHAVRTIIQSTGLTTTVSGMIDVVSGYITGFYSTSGYPHGISILARYDEARSLARVSLAIDVFPISMQTHIDEIVVRAAGGVNGLFDYIDYEFFSNSLASSITIRANVLGVVVL